ncbi:MAG: helix-turn-helix domain-containing protein [Clostridiales bacterium]|nr:helix-turn-helix domain-containing protein [Clostridiales bacterium]
MNNYQKIAAYFDYIKKRYNVYVCVKDFCGFVPLNKELDMAIKPYLTHTNPYCMCMKQNMVRHSKCLLMTKYISAKLEKEGEFFGYCHAGLGEYVLAIRNDENLIGAIFVGFFQKDESKSLRRINNLFRRDVLEKYRAVEEYNTISSDGVFIREEDILPPLRMAAECLGNSYGQIKKLHASYNAVEGKFIDTEDGIIVAAMEYVQENYGKNFKVADIAKYCRCTESHLSRMFKKRIGVGLVTYINKVRIEISKARLLETNDAISAIGIHVGYQDPNYFSRIFNEMTGYPPTEFRRRFRENMSAQPPYDKKSPRVAENKAASVDNLVERYD